MALSDRASVAAPPRGFRDILPSEARELRAIQRSLTESFRSYGYVPLQPPMVERVTDSLLAQRGRLIQFLDRDGAVLALRPDITTAVARLVAQRYRDVGGALRLAYFAPVFREEPAMLGAEREYDQAGVELVGPSGPLADAEVLALLAQSLAGCGLQGVSIEVGHVGVVRRLFADVGADVRERVLADLRRGDVVQALGRARAGGMHDDALDRAQRTLAARGPHLDESDVDGIGNLREVIALAHALYPGDGAWGMPNVALVPELPYYTGLVFEAIHPATGFPVATGGRYDLLLGEFGTPSPATGFAINVPRLHRALFECGWRPARERPLISLGSDGDPMHLARLAAQLRARGLAVAIGDVAEPAGVSVVAVELVDESKLRAADGRVFTCDELAHELT